MEAILPPTVFWSAMGFITVAIVTYIIADRTWKANREATCLTKAEDDELWTARQARIDRSFGEVKSDIGGMRTELVRILNDQTKTMNVFEERASNTRHQIDNEMHGVRLEAAVIKGLVVNVKDRLDRIDRQ